MRPSYFQTFLLLPKVLTSGGNGSGKGPELQTATTEAEVVALNVENTEEFFRYATPAIKAVKEGLDNRVPLVDLPASMDAPLLYGTRAGIKRFWRSKKIIFNEPRRAKVMLEKITEATIRYLHIQLDAGCDAVQIFDSWGGMLSPALYDEFSLPYMERITKAVKDRVPVILFAKGAWYALDKLHSTGASALGLSWMTSPNYARKVCGPDAVFQGSRQLLC